MPSSQDPSKPNRDAGDVAPSAEPDKDLFDRLTGEIDALFGHLPLLLGAAPAASRFAECDAALARIAELRRELDAMEFLIRKRSGRPTPGPSAQDTFLSLGHALAAEPQAGRTVGEHKASILAKREAAGLPPVEAPELWADRQGRKENPVAFIRRVYGRYIGNGLTRAHIRRLDLPLYKALSVWTVRHPEDTLPELPTRSDAVDLMLESLSPDMTEDQVRRLGLTLQSRRRAAK